MEKPSGLSIGRPSTNKALALKSLTTEKPVRVNVDLSPEQHKNLKFHAIEQSKSVSDILRDLIDTHIPKIKISKA